MDCKWSSRDYRFAKILKDFGVENVFRTPAALVASDENDCFTLPWQAFQAVKVSDECWLSDIIYEYESYFGKELL